MRIYKWCKTCQKVTEVEKVWACFIGKYVFICKVEYPGAEDPCPCTMCNPEILDAIYNSMIERMSHEQRI